MRLYRQTVQDFCLYTGLELTEEEHEKLRSAAEEMSAKMRAVRIISASTVSKKDLEKRLIQKGEKPAQAQKAVAWMEDLNLLDDRETACQIVDRCIRKGYGLMRAKQALYEKQIPKSYWDEALSDYPDQKDAIAEFLHSKGITADSDQKELKKAIDALIRRGHSYGTIRKVLELDDFVED